MTVGKATSLLGNGPFRRLWIAQFSALTVVYGLSLAGAVLVEEQTHSSTQIGLVILSSILPAFLASLVSGAVVDRWGRVQVLMASHLARGGVALAFWLGTRLLPPGPALTSVYVVNVTGAIFSQFAIPAELALLPDLVDSSRLMSANGVLQISTLVAEGLGIVLLSPLVIKLAGAPAMGLVGAGLCLLAVALVVALPKDRPARTKRDSEESLWLELSADLQAGWRAVVQDRLLGLVAIQATLAATLLLVLLSLVPGLASRYLGIGVEDAPFLLLPGGLGFAFGAFLVGRWEKRWSRAVWIAVGLTVFGLSVGLLSILSAEAEHLGFILPLIFGLGLALAMVIIPARTVLQEHPPAELRGRVIAAQLALANATAVLPVLLGGALADHLGIRPVMGLLGLLALGAGALSLHPRWY
jgi:DHA3 family macrolide efflux protein-like MFS transporter